MSNDTRKNLTPNQVGYLVRDHLADLPRMRRAIPATGSFNKSMQMLSEHVPETLTTIERLMTTGSAGARDAIATDLMEAIDLYLYGGGLFIHSPERIEPQLLMLWNSENVADEIGRAGDFDFRKTSRLMQFDFSVRKAFSDNEWRGHAAFIIAFEETGHEVVPTSGHILDFISWIGTEKDIAGAIYFARDRQTMDPETIKALISSPGSTTALREGVL